MTGRPLKPPAGRRVRMGGACLIILVVAGCARTGDLGRREPSFVTDTLWPAIGYLSGSARGEPPSTSALTDDEQAMRDRAWRFLMPAHERLVFERHLTELARSHVLPKEAAETRPDVYKVAIGGDTASPISRYRRLTSDIDADRALIPPFSANAARVAEADAIRQKALGHLPLAIYDRENAELRIAENKALLFWVCEKLTAREQAYQIALNGLIVEVPHKIAVESERSLIQLKSDIRILCASVSGPPRSPRQRFTPRGPADKPPVAKG